MMNDITRSRTRRTAGTRRSGALALAALIGTGVLAVGCGSSSDDGAFDEFVGTWTIEPTTSHFVLNCPFLTTPFEFPLWSAMDLQEGVLSDLVELNGACPFYFDVNGKVATVPNPDPYTKAAPICRIDESSDTVIAFLEFQPSSWKINLLAPEKGQPPRAQMIGNARVPFITIDAAGEPMPDPAGPCTYVVNADLTKIGKR